MATNVGIEEAAPRGAGTSDLQELAKRHLWMHFSRQSVMTEGGGVPIIVKGEPIRASRRSAVWCLETVEQLWRVREMAIAEPERDAARKTFRWAVERYRQIAAECPEGS